MLNAIIAARVEPDRFTALDNRLAPNPPYEGFACSTRRRLRCAYDDGTEPYVLHQYVRKPWLEPTLYTRLLAAAARACSPAPASRSRCPSEMIPAHDARRARRRRRAGVGTTREWLRWHLRDQLPDAIGSRMKALFERRDARAER